MSTRRRRKPIVPVPPRGLRPKLDAGQVRDTSLIHTMTLDDIARGTAGPAQLREAVACALTWSRVAESLGAGEAEMKTHMEVIASVTERFKAKGVARFTGEEYQAAKRGVMVMDELAEMVDRPTAVAAALWSEKQIARVTL